MWLSLGSTLTAKPARRAAPRAARERAGMDHALAVVAHHQPLAAGQLALDDLEQARERRAREVGARLAVGAHHLLGVGDDAGLDRGRPRGIRHHAARGRARARRRPRAAAGRRRPRPPRRAAAARHRARAGWRPRCPRRPARCSRARPRPRARGPRARCARPGPTGSGPACSRPSTATRRPAKRATMASRAARSKAGVDIRRGTLHRCRGGVNDRAGSAGARCRRSPGPAPLRREAAAPRPSNRARRMRAHSSGGAGSLRARLSASESRLSTRVDVAPELRHAPVVHPGRPVEDVDRHGLGQLDHLVLQRVEGRRDARGVPVGLAAQQVQRQLERALDPHAAVAVVALRRGEQARRPACRAGRPRTGSGT